MHKQKLVEREKDFHKQVEYSFDFLILRVINDSEASIILVTPKIIFIFFLFISLFGREDSAVFLSADFSWAKLRYNSPFKLH